MQLPDFEKTPVSLQFDIDRCHERIFELDLLLPVFSEDDADDTEKVDRFHEINNQILFESNKALKLYDELDALWISITS